MLPTAPTTNASNSTDRLTWRRDAPSARSRASSRLRCATRIENVLMIRNEPTTSAMPANTSRKIVMNRIASSSWLAATSAALSPVMARASAGSTLATLSRSSCWETPSSAVTQIVLKPSRPSRNRRCAVLVSQIVAVAPLRVPPSGKSARPTSVGVSRARLVALTMRTLSPIT